MGNQIPAEIRDAVTTVISRQAPASIFSFTAASGGCINSGGRVDTSAGSFFLKWNRQEPLPGMFKAEAKGLEALRATRAIYVPEVIAAGASDTYQYLLLEYVPQERPRNDYWTVLGRQLANLHRTHGQSFGLDHNNYIGRLPQLNENCSGWTDFFISQRVGPLLEQALQQGKAPRAWRASFDRLFTKLDIIFPHEPPSLLHGDLWQGNVISNAIGAPCLIDPAVYYGHREMDLAMTRLFGGFDESFYDSYHEAYPLLPGFQERLDVYNLYPLLVHLLLFGSSYAAPIQSTLNALL